MLNLRCIVTSLVLITSGIYLVSNISSISEAEDTSSDELQNEQQVSENSFKYSADMYHLDQLVQMLLGPNAHIGF